MSILNCEVFKEQTRGYKDEVLPRTVTAHSAVEASASQGRQKYVSDRGDGIALDRSGSSAPARVLLENSGFTPEAVAARAAALVGKMT